MIASKQYQKIVVWSTSADHAELDSVKRWLMHSWRQSDEGQWVIENSKSVEINEIMDYQTNLKKYTIIAELDEELHTYYTLRWK